MAAHLARKECAGSCANVARVTQRQAVERQIEVLIDQPDAINGDADMEAGGDAEPSLGWSTTMAIGTTDDREGDGSEWNEMRQT